MTVDSGSSLHVAPEVPLVLEVDGTAVARWHCTPKDLEALAAGWLLSEGHISVPEDIRGLGSDGSGVLTARLDDEASRALLRRVGAETGPAPSRAALEHVPRRPARLSRRSENLLLRPARLAALFQDMLDRAPLRAAGGGLHTGGLIVDDALVHVAEDVGKHNVVDKLIGWAVLERWALEGSIVLLSGRITAPVAAKACRTGVAAMASMSIPTTLARDLARRSGLVLVGRSRSSSPQIHWP